MIRNEKEIKALLKNFNCKFDDFCKRDKALTNSLEALIFYFAENSNEESDIQKTFDIKLKTVVKAVSTLAYFMGVDTGIKVLSSLQDPNFMDNVLSITDSIIDDQPLEFD